MYGIIVRIVNLMRGRVPSGFEIIAKSVIKERHYVTPQTMQYYELKGYEIENFKKKKKLTAVWFQAYAEFFFIFFNGSFVETGGGT